VSTSPSERRFTLAGLRWRLTAWVAGVLVFCAAVVFLVVYNSTGSQLTGQINRAVTVDTNQLAQALRTRGGGTPGELTISAARYLKAQPFSATSTLLFVIIPGAATASNHPELFSAPVTDTDESTQDQTRERVEGEQLQAPRLGLSTQIVPDLGRVRIFERAVEVRAMRVVAGAGQPLEQVESAQDSVARAFLIAGAAAIVIVLLASYLAGARVSAPLRRMAAVASRVDAGDLNPRMDVSSSRGDEVQVLGDSFNHMLDRLSEAFARQREFVADASHELRTPITVIRGQLEVLAAQGAPSAEEVERVNRLVQAEIARTTRLIDDLLVLAQADRAGFLRLEPVDVSRFVEELWDGVSLTADRHFELGPVPAGSLIADPDRLAQALRNLARNAIEHTSSPAGLVRLEVSRAAGERIRFAIIDDGPGIPKSERELIFERFHRTDPARSRANGGAGLGLAIVRAIAISHGGDVRASDGPRGRGARVELMLPRFRAA
jgi:two-component system OmpR family sensor kinase